MLRWIMHVDMDAFFASVEMLDNPKLEGLPVVVGGLGPRGVVATCSYAARAFGVHSAMPVATARRLCPEAVFLPVRMERYSEVSKRIMALFEELSPVVEQLSIDEAFLDVSGMERLWGDPRKLALAAKQRIRSEIGITASVGLAPNKFLAKLASDWQKPDGFTVIEHADAEAFIAPLSVRKIFGIGEASAAALSQYGIVRIGQLAGAELKLLKKIFGKNAEAVKLLAQGIDERPVEPAGKAKSIGREITFAEDLVGKEACRRELLTLSGLVGFRLRGEGLCGRTLTLKVKYADFKTATRSLTPESLISCDEDIYRLAVKLLEELRMDKCVRLLGLTISSLTPFNVSVLGFTEEERMRARNAATDMLKARYGENIIFRGFKDSAT